ncbi:O-antigen ligase [Bradyrhizobium sp. USDA 4341]
MAAQAVCHTSSQRNVLSDRRSKWASSVRFIKRLQNEPRASENRITVIDLLIVLLALAFPWSTTATTILAAVIVLMVVSTYCLEEMIGELKRPACALPLVLLGLAAIGTTWAHGIPWSDRLHAFGKVSKFICFLPLFVHFRNTSRAKLVFGAYVASNLLLLVLSFLVFFSPEVYAIVGAKAPGVPLKNYLDQSQAFVLIAVIFVALAVESVRLQHVLRSVLFIAVSAAFLANLAFVNIARTAFIYLPVMLALVLIRYARGWSSVAICAAICAVAVGVWGVSPNLQFKMARLLGEVDAFQTNTMFVDGYETGGAERLEFWRKSIDFIRSAPILGHGTGSTKDLFATEAAGQTGIRAKVVDNPHNQTLAVAIQWGLLGCLVLYAMWAAHLLLFRAGLGGRPGNLLAWIGLLAVVQNLASSLLNSHLFDFYQGWLYVFAAAMVGGQLQRNETLSRANT